MENLTAGRGYREIAAAYADGIRVLFAPATARGERGAAGPASYQDLAEQAGRLAPLSGELTLAAEGRLTDPDPEVRSRAEAQLLAKALADLEVGTYLLLTAGDEQGDLDWAAAAPGERSGRTVSVVEPYLQLVLGEGEPGQAGPTRSGSAPADPATARQMLALAIEDTLALISQRASQAGQAALGGLTGLGLGEVARAAGVVGMDLAQAIGKAEQVSRLYDLCREFGIRAYESLVALLGPQVAHTVAERVLAWWEKVRAGEQFGRIVEGLYDTRTTRAELNQLIDSSQVALTALGRAIQEVETLDEAFRQKVRLAEDLLGKLKYLSLLPVSVLPQGRLLQAAAYLALGGWVVLAGADYVDARSLRLLDRAPGIRQVVIRSLELPPEKA